MAPTERKYRPAMLDARTVGILLLVMLGACTATSPDDTKPAHKAFDAGTPDPVTGIWRPSPKTSWQWQLSGTFDTSVDAAVYDVDLFNTDVKVIDQLHAQGRKVICYFDTAYEPGRPDASAFVASVLGNDMEGWPEQKWVDIRTATVRNIMTARMELAVQKRCDSVEADDLDVLQNNSGFPITAADQLAFCRGLAAEAHARKLSIALKNNVDEIADLVADFDYAINEECSRYNECDTEQPFVTEGKAVLHAEYHSTCPAPHAGFSTILKHLNLDAWRLVCP